MLPIGGTQVAGTRYDVTYPAGVGIPVLSSNMVLIVDTHFTNPFQPPQEIYGEDWLNIYLYKPGEFQVLLDGIFAINFGDLFVEPYQTRTISRVWQPVGLLSRQSADAAVFQLFGHMHKRATAFQIDVVRGGHCSGNPAWACGRDDDCRCWFPQRTRGNCQAGQTCVRGPDAEDSTIYYTDAWDRAPVMNFQKPYLLVNHDQGLRWTCTHTNGIEGDPNHPPKVCKEGLQRVRLGRGDADLHLHPGRGAGLPDARRRPTRRASPCRSSSARPPTTTCATCSATSSTRRTRPGCPEGRHTRASTLPAPLRRGQRVTRGQGCTMTVPVIPRTPCGEQKYG